MRPDQLEDPLRVRLDALGPAPRAELLHVLPDLERVGAIQSYWGNPATRNFAELRIDCEEDQTHRAVLVGMLQTAASEDENLPLLMKRMRGIGGPPSRWAVVESTARRTGRSGRC